MNMVKRWKVKWDEIEVPDGMYVLASDFDILAGVAEAQEKNYEAIGAKLNARIASLEAALRDVYEIYAGSEGLPESTASEAYLTRLVRQMAHRAAETFTVETK